MADYIPEEIIINILHRLPVNTLLRCTAVCKSWYALITAAHFISSHFKSSPLLLLRRCITNSERYDLYSDDSASLPHHSTFQFPFTAINSHFTIVGSCNGLLCLSDDRVFYTSSIILWNPSVRRSVILPKPNMIYNSHGSFIQCLGFGFASASNDYKVIRITYVDLVSEPRIEVYRLSSGRWRDKSYSDLDSVIYNRSSHVYANGASHWIARYMDSYDLILSFDMSREVFRKIMLPIPAGAANDVVSVRNMELMVFRDCLALAVWNVEQSLCVVVLQDGRIVSCGHSGGVVEEFGSGESRSDEYKRALHVSSYTSSLVLVERRSYLRDVVTCKNSQIDYKESSILEQMISFD